MLPTAASKCTHASVIVFFGVFFVWFFFGFVFFLFWFFFVVVVVCFIFGGEIFLFLFCVCVCGGKGFLCNRVSRGFLRECFFLFACLACACPS